MSRDSDPCAGPHVITGETVGLGQFTRDMSPLCERWFNDLRVSRTLGVNWHPITRRMKAQHLDEMIASSDSYFTIYELDMTQPIGVSSLNDIDNAHGTAEFSIVIGEPAAWGKGFGTEAARLTLTHAFDVLGLYNVWLQVSANNPGAIRAYEKAGFQIIGIRRCSVRIGRELVDDVYMDAVATDFEPSTLRRVVHPPEESR